jgi:signal transduction histidine kinase
MTEFTFSFLDKSMRGPMNTQDRFLKDERQLTDDSLIAERVKTNQSLSNSRTNTEIQIDQAMEAARTRADSKNENRQISSGYKVEDEKQNGHERVARERERSDNAVELERSQVDAVLEREREIKSALASRLLEQERKLTDKNLSFERTQTDSEIFRSADLLTREIANHSKTKISLTSRDEFLAIVSHDLRNPIGAASSCAEMLLEEPTYKGMDPEIKYWIEFIKRNVDTSLRMITDLLDMERMAHGKLVLKIDQHKMGQIILQSVESFTHLASAKSVLLRVKEINAADVVRCDQDRILQVLSNLLGNALKFIPEGGLITVEASFSPSEVTVAIADSGPGIAEEKLGKIFERFSQINSKDRRGLGLGLYISKMLIEAHGGRIWVESTVNKGSTFYFTVPISVPNSSNGTQG